MSEAHDEHVEERRERTSMSGRAAAKARIEQQHTWVDLQVQQAMARGEFDNLPGAGKPLRDLGDTHDPNWWVKKLIERERVVVLPPSILLRKEDSELDDRLDGLTREAEVRRQVEDFNQRVIAARYRLPEGPPLITMPRDVDATVAAWAERRRARSAERRHQAAPAHGVPGRRGWWRWVGRGDSPGTR